MARTRSKVSATLPPEPSFLTTGRWGLYRAKGPDRLDSGLGQLFFRGTPATSGRTR
jgi:hypothetical protein